MHTSLSKRKTMEKFGKTKGSDPASEAMHITKSVEEVPIELCKKIIVLSQATLGGFLRNFNYLFKYGNMFCIIWYLGGFGSMQNTPTGCGSHLLTRQTSF
jgi:hypothetical protein